LIAAAAAATPAALILASAGSAVAQPTRPARPATAPSRACPPGALAVSFSDSLDKLVRNGIELGGLSSLAFDRRSAAYVSAVDNHGTDPARIWFFRNLADPKVVRDPWCCASPTAPRTAAPTPTMRAWRCRRTANTW